MTQLTKLLLAHTDYSAWATSQLLKACSRLTFDQLDSGLGASHSSILRTFRHIATLQDIPVSRPADARTDHIQGAQAASALGMNGLATRLRTGA